MAAHRRMTAKKLVPRLRAQRERGASLVFTMVSILVLLPFVGLAIDGATVFWAKAKLSAAVDAAALAAGRNPTSNANTTAQQYVYANFPTGWMGTSYTVAPSGTVTYPATYTRQVSVNATVSVPTFFLNILGITHTNVPATATSTRRSSNIILVLDRSGSMNAIGADGATNCNTMKAAATTFVNYFSDGQDNVALLTFQTWANVDFSFSTTFQSSITSLLSDLQCGTNTSSAMALNMAYNQIKNLGSAAYASNGALNVIVFFTDGNPNGITANYKAKNLTDARYYSGASATLDSSMPATGSACISGSYSLAKYPPGVLLQGNNGQPTGETQGLYPIYTSSSQAPTAVCASGQTRPICVTAQDLPITVANSDCHFQVTPYDHSNLYPDTGPVAAREDIAYIPLKDYYGDSTVNSSFMTQSSDLITGTYASSGAMRADTPQSVMDASFNAADAQALTIISDTTYKPVIYTIGLGGANDVPNQSVFETFLRRVANDPTSNRYNSSLPTGLFVYSPDDTQLAAAFQQIASQILRLSK